MEALSASIAPGVMNYGATFAWRIDASVLMEMVPRVEVAHMLELKCVNLAILASNYPMEHVAKSDAAATMALGRWAPIVPTMACQIVPYVLKDTI